MADDQPPSLLDKAIEQKQFLTGRISETVRYLCFGVLAIFYGLISSDSAYAARTVAAHPDAIRLAAVAAIVALVLDYAQYVAGRLSVAHAIARTDAPGKYDRKRLFYRVRGWSFWAKQAATLIGTATMVWTIAVSF